MPATAQQIAEKFPSFAPLAKIPEIQKLLVEAADPANDWTTEMFTAKLHETKWWKANPEAARKSIALSLGDPAEHRNQLIQYIHMMDQVAQSQGIQWSWQVVLNHANLYMMAGYSMEQIRQDMVRKAKPDQMRGTLDQVTANILELAGDYGVTISKQWAFDQAKKQEAVGANMDAATSLIRDWAKGQYAHLAKQIDEGFTVKQIAEPYMQSAAELLEITPTKISMTDPKFQKAINFRGEDGKNRVMSMEEWQKNLMKDKAYGWDRTMNAKQQAFAMRDQLAETFGSR